MVSECTETSPASKCPVRLRRPRFVALGQMESKTRKRIRLWVLIAVALYLLTHPWLFLPRFWVIQFHGRVPVDVVDATRSDWFLAERTSWWGKRLDPEKFWKGRPVWYDSNAEFVARRRGRGYPPIPPGITDPKILRLSDKDRTSDGFSLSGSQPSYVASEREGVFWNTFYYTHPHPPSKIEYEQKELAQWFLGAQWDLKYGANIVKLTSQEVEKMFISSVRELCKGSFPKEAFGKDTLFWCYVFCKRNEYQEQLAQLGSPEEAFARLRSAGYVDKKYITEPLSADDIRAANAWKFLYLRRLRQEKTDESYINAYIQAWNLSSNEVWTVTR